MVCPSQLSLHWPHLIQWCRLVLLQYTKEQKEWSGLDYCPVMRHASLKFGLKGCPARPSPSDPLCVYIKNDKKKFIPSYCLQHLVSASVYNGYNCDNLLPDSYPESTSYYHRRNAITDFDSFNTSDCVYPIGRGRKANVLY
jgi:hypothetical protein